MKCHHIVLSVAILALLGACAAGGDVDQAGSRSISFEQDAIGSVPRGFVVAETNGTGSPASWRVGAGIDPDDPGHAVRVDTQNTGSTYNLLLSTVDHAADTKLSVYVIPRSGKEDQGGGLVWRARSPDNYYIARWNPLENNVRLYKVVGGKRTMLGSADTSARPQIWHRLWVTVRGATMVVGMDGDKLIERQDDTFSGGGRFGLWTKADATTLFDLLEITDAKRR